MKNDAKTRKPVQKNAECVMALQGCPHYKVTILARVPHACIIFENSIFDLNSRQQTSQDLNPDLWDQFIKILLHSIWYKKAKLLRNKKI